MSLIEVGRPALKSGAGTLIASRNRHERGYRFYLGKGFCVALTANQDNHFFTWGDDHERHNSRSRSPLANRDDLHALKRAALTRPRITSEKQEKNE